MDCALEYDDASPKPGAMIESLRAFGYDLQTAIADLVDNSIAAGSKNVWLHFHWDGEYSTISIRDDGRGMTESELIEAMRIGSHSPLEVRDRHDLGRFGLGLKTASFSQCRLLTVRSRKRKGAEFTRCWDLDYVVKHNEWRLLRDAPSKSEPHLQELEQRATGTIVLWQNMDRLVWGTKTNDSAAQSDFLRLVDIVRDHLAMIFHDYMQGTRAIKFWINNQLIVPWNPFLANHPSTQQLPVETLSLGKHKIEVTPYVLPHYTRLDSDTFIHAGGPNGWNAHQGFYIYRNRRLLIPGDWLGLGFQKEEHYKLTRIRIDLPNDLDEEWQLDVRKAYVHPPSKLCESLKRIARLTRSTASEVYRHRGAKLISKNGKDHLFLWEQKVRHGKVFYSINREHPLVNDVLQTAGDKASVRALLRLTEETVPVALITINNSEKPEQHATPFEQVKTNQIATVMRQAYKAILRNQKLTPRQAKERLAMMEPFNRFPELIASLDEYGNDESLLTDTEIINEVGKNRND